MKKIEEDMAQTVGRKYGVAVSNGTAALEVACQALKISAGDEIIMPAFTIISCARTITKLGAVLVLVGSGPNTWNMDVNHIESKITKRTKAIMVVHTYGLPVDMDSILEIANKYVIKIIEDAAEMHGQTYKGKPCGSFGDISTFSFYPNKHITTGEGGMVLVDDEELAERCRMLRNLCFRKDVRYVHDEISDNYRFTNLQAAVGLAQLERLDEFVEIKRKMGKCYTARLKNIICITLPVEHMEYADNIYWVFGIVLSNELPFDNKEFQKKLAENGVGSRTFFYPIHKQPVYRKRGLFVNESYPIAEMLSERGLYIQVGCL